MAVAYDNSSGKKILNAKELIDLSILKTAEIKKTLSGRNE
jgi:hypothetical protein